MNVNAKCPSEYIFAGDTLLHATVIFGKTSLVEKLLSHDADVMAVNDDNETALLKVSYGALQGDVVGSVKLLLENGANPNATAKKDDKFRSRFKGQTLLMLLLKNANQPKKRFEIIKDLLKFGAKVTLEDNKGQTAMDIAKKEGLDDVLALMKPAFEKEMKVFNRKAAVLHKENIQKAQDHTTPKPRRRPMDKGR